MERTMTENKQPFSSIAKNGEEVRKIKKWQRVIPPVIGVIVMLLVLVYIFSLLFNRYGSFTISVKDFADRKYSLTLSETASFKRTTSRLNAAAANDITNISYKNIPKDVNDVDGAHNGENYLAYTFYLKNSGEETCNYRYSIIISKATSGIDAAARIRVYYNEDFYKSATDEFNYSGDFVDYAKPKTGGNGEPETDKENRTMTNFESESLIVKKDVDNFASGDVAKITVVIWLEGDDSDCVDDILGGQLKIDMVMEILGGSDENE